jgi:hypothetical protein
MEPNKSPGSSPSMSDLIEQAPAGMLGELWLFIRATGKWWLVPVLIVLLLLGTLVLLSGSCYAPFIYTLF